MRRRDPRSHAHRPIHEDVLETVGALEKDARDLEAIEAIRHIEQWARERSSDARWLRERYAWSHSFEDLVWNQARRWSGRESTERD